MAKRTKITHSSSRTNLKELTPMPFGETPLLPDLVVDNIFNFCDFNTLSNCRLVCKNWHRLSLRGWLESAPQLRLMPTKPRNSNSAVSISKFLQTCMPKARQLSSPFLNVGLRQYKNFILEQFNDCKPQWAKLTIFMENFGDRITNLELKDTGFGNTVILRNILTSKYTPNLKTLKVSIWYRRNANIIRNNTLPENNNLPITLNQQLTTLSFRVRNPDGAEPFPIEWLELFSHYPNLRNLELGFIRSTHVSSVLQAVSKCQLAIESLSFVIDDHRSASGFEGRLLPDALVSLKKFTFDGEPLQSLEMLRSYPSLAILTLKAPCGTVDEPPQIPGGFRLNHLTTFYCNYDKWTRGHIDLLARFMPNVTKLRIPLTNDTFRAICTHWVQLEELTLLAASRSVVREEAITGLRSGEVNHNRNEENITKLQGLKSFRMEDISQNPSTPYPTFSSNCVVYGFICLPLLKELELLVSPTTTMGVSQDIQAHLPFAKLTLPKYWRTNVDDLTYDWF